MKKAILIYGLLGGLLIALLKLVEYRFLIIEHSLEVYGGIVAVLFSVLGIWLGLKLTRTRAADCRGPQQPGDRRAALRQREHGEDALRPTYRQAGRRDEEVAVAV